MADPEPRRPSRPEQATPADAKAHDGLFWRKLAYLGATRGPDWWVRFSPPVFGGAAALAVPAARRAVLDNLRRIRGPATRLDDARDMFATFGAYASCLAEVLSNDAPSGPRAPTATIYGERFAAEAIRHARGIIMVTAHTAGWECIGPLLELEGLRLMIAMEPERDARARALHDHARRRAGVEIVHVGDPHDPLASLPLLRHLKSGGVVALQLDRVAPGMRTRDAWLLGERGAIPEGPLRLAQLSRSPIMPLFCGRVGYRRYVIEAFEPRFVDRAATEAELDDVAQHLATSMTRFLRAHPTQWLKFA